MHIESTEAVRLRGLAERLKVRGDEREVLLGAAKGIWHIP